MKVEVEKIIPREDVWKVKIAHIFTDQFFLAYHSAAPYLSFRSEAEESASALLCPCLFYPCHPERSEGFPHLACSAKDYLPHH
jgi:hypothetical protein